MAKIVSLGAYQAGDPNGYDESSYPQGVANPYVPAVIPYPSNLHGSMLKYTRDGHRFLPAVYNVLSGVDDDDPELQAATSYILLQLADQGPFFDAKGMYYSCTPREVYRAVTIELARQMSVPSAQAAALQAYIENAPRVCGMRNAVYYPTVGLLGGITLGFISQLATTRRGAGTVNSVGALKSMLSLGVGGWVAGWLAVALQSKRAKKGTAK